MVRWRFTNDGIVGKRSCKCVHPLQSSDVDGRYWGANIHWKTRPDMSQRERERLIHRKYVLKEYVDRSESWELEMQKRYPLTKNELAVLDYINERQLVKPTTEPETSLPTAKEERRYARKPRGEQEKRATSRDKGRWSDEIVCDGRSVMVAKVAIQNNSGPRLSETVINDGRMRGRVIPVKDIRTHEPSPPSSRRPSQPAKGFGTSRNRNIELNATPATTPSQPRSENTLERPKSTEIPPMIDVNEPLGEMKLDLLGDISMGSRSETGIESLVGKCSVTRSGGSSAELWDIMQGF